MSSLDPKAPRGFFSSLYDLSFHKFVTPAIIEIIYVISLIVLALWAIAFLIVGFVPHPFMIGYAYGSIGIFFMVFHVVGAIAIFILGSIAARISLEFVVAVFRIAENTESLRPRE